MLKVTKGDTSNLGAHLDRFATLASVFNTRRVANYRWWKTRNFLKKSNRWFPFFFVFLHTAWINHIRHCSCLHLKKEVCAYVCFHVLHTVLSRHEPVPNTIQLSVNLSVLAHTSCYLSAGFVTKTIKATHIHLKARQRDIILLTLWHLMKGVSLILFKWGGTKEEQGRRGPQKIRIFDKK